MSGSPPSLSPSLTDLRFVCPACKGSLGTSGDAFECPACTRLYPLQRGIPDFRLAPDPYLSISDDHARTEIILARLDELSFPELLAYYWSFSDVTPPALRERFIENALRGVDRASRILEVLDRERDRDDARPGKTVLEIGSGTGNLLAAWGKRPGRVVGVDVAMRWLHVSRCRLRDLGLPEPALVCASGEHLPFEDESFDATVSLATLEFVPDASRLFSEVHRTLKRGATFVLNAVNRFSPTEEPHVFLWGVGFLPRSRQARYVRWRRGARFEAVTLRSRGELARLAREFFDQIEFQLPEIVASSVDVLPTGSRWKVNAYLRLKRAPLFKWLGPLLVRLVPEWDIRMKPRP